MPRLRRHRSGPRPGARHRHRDFYLYLAWFEPELVKIGAIAATRGHDRLLEQGAITFTVLTIGSHATIRTAEQAVTAARQVTGRARASTWWALPAPTERAAQLEAARARIADRIT